MKKTWQQINILLSRNLDKRVVRKLVVNIVTYETESDLCNVFNEYFCSIGNSLDAEIPVSNIDPLEYMNFNSDTSLWLSPVSITEVYNIIGSLKNSKQHINSISIPLLKDNSFLLSPIICNLINACFSHGKFPDCLKVASAIPLF